MPRAHGPQAFELVEPSTAEKVPAAHATQALTPSWLVYVPAEHSRHDADELAAAALEYLPTGHAVHPMPLGTEL